MARYLAPHHYNRLSDVTWKRFSVNASNTEYVIGPDGSNPHAGIPDILYDDLIIVRDASLLWTHGKAHYFRAAEQSGGTPHYYIMDDCLDPMIAMGEEKQYNFSLIDARGFDMTDRVTGWKIRRETADTVADDLWACKAKVKAFAGSIGLTWSSDPTLNDMDPNETVNTTNFRVTAYIDDVPVAEELIML